MPLTSQIIAEIVRREIGVQLGETNQKIDQLARISSAKLDNLSAMLTEYTAASSMTSREQSVLAARITELKKRLEKLETTAG